MCVGPAITCSMFLEKKQLNYNFEYKTYIWFDFEMKDKIKSCFSAISNEAASALKMIDLVHVTVYYYFVCDCWPLAFM